jgi:ATP diphosphatase
MSDIDSLLQLMRRLRDPRSGCPWDLEQNFDTIVPYTIEEAYEVADAVQRRRYDELKDELGDLLFQVVFHAQMASEAGLFDFEDVVRTIVDKMTRRHPHVFGDAKVADAEEQTRAWEALKARERAEKDQQGSVLDQVPLALPALSRAAKLQKRAARQGFDWPQTAPVVNKIREELEELQAELDSGDRERQEEELGDLLFSCVNLARHLELDPEHTLRRANEKFARRYRALEAYFQSRNQTPNAATPEQLEAAWSEIKHKEIGD